MDAPRDRPFLGQVPNAQLGKKDIFEVKPRRANIFNPLYQIQSIVWYIVLRRVGRNHHRLYRKES